MPSNHHLTILSTWIQGGDREDDADTPLLQVQADPADIRFGELDDVEVAGVPVLVLLPVSRLETIQENLIAATEGSVSRPHEAILTVVSIGVLNHLELAEPDRIRTQMVDLGGEQDAQPEAG